jgi:hypothetical protein
VRRPCSPLPAPALSSSARLPPKAPLAAKPRGDLVPSPAPRREALGARGEGSAFLIAAAAR